MSTDNKKTPDYLRVIALVRQIGSKNGFEPIPFDQIKWQQRGDQPPLQRLWSWLISKTLKKGHWSPYAISKQAQDGGYELNLEHAAADLGCDLANTYRYWKLGVQLGLWRNGTKVEGKRRLYICGSVPQASEEVPVVDPQVSCTDNLPEPIRRIIKDWPADKLAQFLPGWQLRNEIREAALREQMAVTRDILGDQDAVYLKQWDLDLKRQRHTAKGAPAEELEARRLRAASLRPHLSSFVQTIEDSVQSRPETVQGAAETLHKAAGNGGIVGETEAIPHKGNGGESDSRKQGGARSTLLGLDPDRQTQDSRAGVPLSAPHKAGADQRPYQGEEHKQLPAPRSPRPSKLPVLNEVETQAVDCLFSEFDRMRKHYPDTEFGREPFTRDSKPDQLLVYRVLVAVGAENVENFVMSCIRKFKGLDRDDMARLTPRAPGMPGGPHRLALLVVWAEAYGAALDEAARATRAEKARIDAYRLEAEYQLANDPVLAAAAAAADKRNAEHQAKVERGELEWLAMGDAERTRRLDRQKAKLKKHDKDWNLLSPGQCNLRAERAARQELRKELEAETDAGA